MAKRKELCLTDIEFRMQEWGLGREPSRLQRCVRGVLNELNAKALLRLKDRRLEVRVIGGGSPWADSSVWTYLPIHPALQRGEALSAKAAAKQRLALLLARAVGDAREARRADLQCRRSIAQRLRPRRQTRVLMVFSRAGFESEPARVLKAHLRDHLGHVLLYLRNPKARNECPDAQREWERSTAVRTKVA